MTRGGYGKRTMAADVADVIAALGLAPVTLVGHDRGARVAHRLALDHPALLTRLVLLDIAPTSDVFARTDRVRARARRRAAARVPRAAAGLGARRAPCAGPFRGHAVPDSGPFIPEEQPQAVV